MSDVIGKFSFLKENKNFKRYRECDFFLDSSIKSRNKKIVKKNSDIPISLKYDSLEETSKPTIILFYFNNTPKEIKEDWEKVPSTFRTGKDWKTKKSIDYKNKKFIKKQEDVSFNFGFVNLDYEQKLYETFKKIDKFNPFHWAKIRSNEKEHFILFYNKLYPQNFMKGEILKIYEYFVHLEHKAILKFNIENTGTDKYEKGKSYDLVGCNITDKGTSGIIKIVNLKDNDDDPGVVSNKNFNFKLINKGKNYIEGTCYCLSGGSPGTCPAIFKILKSFPGGAGKGNKWILDFKILKTGQNVYTKNKTYDLLPVGNQSGTSGKFKILKLKDNNNPSIISSNKYDFDIINRGNQYEIGASYYLIGGGPPVISPAIFQITNVSSLPWKEKKDTDNSHRTKKFRIHTNHVTFNEGFFKYIGTSSGVSVTIFKYGETRKPSFEGEYRFEENDIFESIGVSSGLCYSSYTGVSTGLIYFAGVCRDINTGTSVFYIHGTSTMYSKFKKIEFEKEKSKKSDIYKQIKKLEGRKSRKQKENLTIKEEDMDDSLKIYLKNQLS